LFVRIQEAARRADGDWKAAAWSLERAFASDFCRPEFQLNLIQQNNATVNALSITIAPQENREIEAVAEPVRASVRQMFERYKPNHGNGDQETNGSVSLSVQEKFASYRSSSGNGE
jgi:hypothetical protein